MWVSAERDRAAERVAGDLAGRLRAAAGRGVEVAGPSEAPSKRINKRFRWMILLKAPAIGPIHRTLRAVLDDPSFKPGHAVRVAVDVDPYPVL